MLALYGLLPFVALASAAPMYKRFQSVKIQSLVDGRCLSPDPRIEIKDYVDTTPVDAYYCGEARSWDIQPGNGAVILSGSNFALDVGFDITSGVPTRLRESTPETPLQAWYLTNDARIAITNGGHCLDEDWEWGPQIYACGDENSNQMWIIIDEVTEKLKVDPEGKQKALAAKSSASAASIAYQTHGASYPASASGSGSSTSSLVAAQTTYSHASDYAPSASGSSASGTGSSYGVSPTSLSGSVYQSSGSGYQSSGSSSAAASVTNTSGSSAATSSPTSSIRVTNPASASGSATNASGSSSLRSQDSATASNTANPSS